MVLALLIETVVREFVWLMIETVAREFVWMSVYCSGDVACHHACMHIHAFMLHACCSASVYFGIPRSDSSSFAAAVLNKLASSSLRQL